MAQHFLSQFMILCSLVLMCNDGETTECPGTGEFLDNQNVRQFEGCEHVRGSLIINRNSTRSGAVSYADLLLLSSIREIDGYLRLDGMDNPEVTDLRFLRRLEVIRGMDTVSLIRRQYSMVIQNNIHLRTLSLASLQQIQNGGVWVAYNRQLCLEDTIHFHSILVGNSRRVVTENNDNCSGVHCSEECDQGSGCWGTLPDECVMCRNYQYMDTCITTCNTSASFADEESMQCLPLATPTTSPTVEPTSMSGTTATIDTQTTTVSMDAFSSTTDTLDSTTTNLLSTPTNTRDLTQKYTTEHPTDIIDTSTDVTTSDDITTSDTTTDAGTTSDPPTDVTTSDPTTDAGITSDPPTYIAISNPIVDDSTTDPSTDQDPPTDSTTTNPPTYPTTDTSDPHTTFSSLDSSDTTAKAGTTIPLSRAYSTIDTTVSADPAIATTSMTQPYTEVTTSPLITDHHSTERDTTTLAEDVSHSTANPNTTTAAGVPHPVSTTEDAPPSTANPDTTAPPEIASTTEDVPPSIADPNTTASVSTTEDSPPSTADPDTTLPPKTVSTTEDIPPNTADSDSTVAAPLSTTKDAPPSSTDPTVRVVTPSLSTMEDFPPSRANPNTTTATAPLKTVSTTKDAPPSTATPDSTVASTPAPVSTTKDVPPSTANPDTTAGAIFSTAATKDTVALPLSIAGGIIFLSLLCPIFLVFLYLRWRQRPLISVVHIYNNKSFVSA